MLKSASAFYEARRFGVDKLFISKGPVIHIYTGKTGRLIYQQIVYREKTGLSIALSTGKILHLLKALDQLLDGGVELLVLLAALSDFPAGMKDSRVVAPAKFVADFRQ